MKKIYGATGSYPEYYTVKHIQNASVITSSSKRAKLFFHDVSVYSDYFKKELNICYIPSEKDPLDIDSQIKRNFGIYNLLYNRNTIVIMDKEALDIPVRDMETFKRDCLVIEVGKEIDRDLFIQTLFRNGYIREEYPENEGEFSVKGGVISIHIPYSGIVEVDFFGDTVENIFLKSLIGTRKSLNKVGIFPLYDFPVINGDRINTQFDRQKSQSISSYIRNIFRIYVDIYNRDDGNLYFFSTGSNSEITTIEEAKNFETVKLPLRQSLVLKSEKKIFLTEKEKTLDLEFDPLKEGDYIIHEDYGIGIFRGIETRNIKGKTYDFMILEYADGEKIYVSYLHFGKIFKYKASGVVKLDKIGGTSWRNLKKKVKNSLKKVAKDLIKLYTERNKITRPPLNINDALIKQFEDSFPYVETPDQMKAIIDIKKDLSSNKPMERVICGDVGFGKTEVALRAVFISVLNGKQVAVLTPTTVLSYQHYRNFKKRLEPFGIKVENLSRLKSKKEIDIILEELESGKIDVVIGTHRILQEDVKFKNLGLLVIDEEHRFGVKAKEKIRHIKKDIDTLYLTATPIPRTLNMALSGLKNLSVIKTPPEGRVETKTFVSIHDENIIKKAISLELKRGGQVFYLHNRIETIQERAEFLKKMFPDASISTAHGKMKPKQIEKVILEFIQKKIDILVSTSIIETGIDIPTANTLIVERADLFGLAQLYHLRGRVGRGNIQAYCYLLVPPEITKDAQRRLDAILRLTRPGSGLKISIEDMQIRGAGNILGVEQSGHIKAVGYDFYIKLLQDVINEETGKKEKEPLIQVNFEAYIPEEFIPDSSERLNLYMTVSKAVDIEEIQQIKEYLSKFYSGLPDIFNLYLNIEKLKRAVKGKGITKIELGEPITHIYIDEENPPEPEIIDRLINSFKVSSISSDRISIFLDKKNIDLLTAIFLSQIENLTIKNSS
ncbi:transcription-repair coupling factor (superfamily II helicase) [Persephonella hydrogeniphila]|uniref:Transcription-repair-coupling factor n=1 Tax=Persephonella hydrogeniphila TaxID=198703 RepID=A0A285MYE6_9AQUI|nr:transcription-repair coupling factor [Persephonella hydrogeniphila]SNZ02229.1 transcription-repair coupling factor (superfamily II helicase) [Persephonella hydrogeniphila]